MIQSTNKIKVIPLENGYKLVFKYKDFLYTRYSPSEDKPKHFSMVDFESGGYFDVGYKCLYDSHETVVDIYENEEGTEVIVQTLTNR